MIRVDFDNFELLFLVEGVFKYCNKNIAKWMESVLPKVGDNMRAFLSSCIERNLKDFFVDGERKGRDTATYNELMSMLSKKVGYDTNSVPLMLSIQELQGYVKSCGFGSHLRQDVWEWMVNHVYSKLSEDEREQMYLWMNRVFKNTFDDNAFKEYYQRCLARYNKSNKYIVFLEYTMNGKHGIHKEEDVYKFNDSYWVDFSRQVCSWENSGDKVELLNAIRIYSSLPHCCSCHYYRRVPTNGFDGKCKYDESPRNRKQEICERYISNNKCARKDV